MLSCVCGRLPFETGFENGLIESIGFAFPKSIILVVYNIHAWPSVCSPLCRKV